MLQFRNISVILGDGHGGFYKPGSQPTINAARFTIPDINGDGKPDLVSVSGATINVSLGNGDGTFGPAASVFLPAPFYSATAIAAADLNGDGSVDLAVVASINGPEFALVVFPNAGKGLFNASKSNGRAGGFHQLDIRRTSL